jgi:hypothetical protein
MHLDVSIFDVTAFHVTFLSPGYICLERKVLLLISEGEDTFVDSIVYSGCLEKFMLGLFTFNLPCFRTPLLSLLSILIT